MVEGNQRGHNQGGCDMERLKSYGLVLGLIFCMASCGALEKQDNDDKVRKSKTVCPTFHYDSKEVIDRKCREYHRKMDAMLQFSRD